MTPLGTTSGALEGSGFAGRGLGDAGGVGSGEGTADAAADADAAGEDDAAAPFAKTSKAARIPRERRGVIKAEPFATRGRRMRKPGLKGCSGSAPGSTCTRLLRRCFWDVEGEFRKIPERLSNRLQPTRNVRTALGDVPDAVPDSLLRARPRGRNWLKNQAHLRFSRFETK